MKNSNLSINLKIIKLLTHEIKKYPELRFQQLLWKCGIIGRNYNDQDELEIEDRFYENSKATFEKVNKVIKEQEETELKNIHKHSINNKIELETAEKCICIYCNAEFTYDKIKDWIDNNTTALCPCCGLDTVIDKSLIKDKKQLENLYKKYFKVK